MRKWCLATMAFGFMCLLSQRVPAEGPAFFRAHSGLAPSSARLPDNFEQDARQVWRVPLKSGISTPCVTKDAVYVTTFDKEQETLATVALDRQTGRVRWESVAPAERIEPFHRTGSPAASTPAWNGERLFVFFGSYGLLCYDADGRLLWDKPMGPFQDEFGAASSPILVDDLVILNEDHDVGSFLIAIEQETGKTVWKTPREGFTRSYATPIVWQQDGKKQLVVAGALQLAAYNLRDGSKAWWVNGLSRIVDSTPVKTDRGMFLATWTPGGDQSERISMEPYGEALASFDKNGDGMISKDELPDGSPVVPRFFRIDLDQDQKLNRQEWEKHAGVFARAQNAAMWIQPRGEGDLTDTSVQWIYRRGLPTVPSSVVYDGVFYMVRDSGIVTSLDAESGRPLKTGRIPGRGNYYASLVAGDGKVYLASEPGVVTVLRAGEKWEVLSSHDFTERILATPVIAGAQLFVRTDEALYCYQKR